MVERPKRSYRRSYMFALLLMFEKFLCMISRIDIQECPSTKYCFNQSVLLSSPNWVQYKICIYLVNVEFM